MLFYSAPSGSLPPRFRQRTNWAKPRKWGSARDIQTASSAKRRAFCRRPAICLKHRAIYIRSPFGSLRWFLPLAFEKLWLPIHNQQPSGILNPHLRTKITIILSSQYAQTNPMRRHSSASEEFEPIWIHMCTLQGFRTPHLRHGSAKYHRASTANACKLHAQFARVLHQ